MTRTIRTVAGCAQTVAQRKRVENRRLSVPPDFINKGKGKAEDRSKGKGKEDRQCYVPRGLRHWI